MFKCNSFKGGSAIEEPLREKSKKGLRPPRKNSLFFKAVYFLLNLQHQRVDQTGFPSPRKTGREEEEGSSDWIGGEIENLGQAVMGRESLGKTGRTNAIRIDLQTQEDERERALWEKTKAVLGF